MNSWPRGTWRNCIAAVGPSWPDKKKCGGQLLPVMRAMFGSKHVQQAARVRLNEGPLARNTDIPFIEESRGERCIVSRRNESDGGNRDASLLGNAAQFVPTPAFFPDRWSTSLLSSFAQTTRASVLLLPEPPRGVWGCARRACRAAACDVTSSCFSLGCFQRCFRPVLSIVLWSRWAPTVSWF